MVSDTYAVAGLTAVVWVALFLTGCQGGGPSETASARTRVDTLITGGTVLTMDRNLTVYQPGFVAVAGETISAVGPMSEADRYRAGHVIDASDQIVLPGLINGHQHAPMVLFRGLGSDVGLTEWLQDYMFPAEANNVDREFVYWGSLLAIVEMVQSGTTTFADMYYFEEEVARATAQVGMRGILGETIIDFPAPDHATPQQTLAYTEGFIREWNDHPLIVPAVAPHAPYTCSKEVLIASRKLADKYDVPLLIHVAESEGEVALIRKRTGFTPIQYLKEIGFLADRVVANHVVWANRQELETLAEFGVGVVHDPESNMKLALGVAPVSEMLEIGVDVGLGTDGAASNNNLDLFQEMDTMAKLHKLASKDPTVMSAASVLTVATMGGAQALNLADRLGSLETGKKADLILVDLTAPAAHPFFDPYSLLVYALTGDSVDTVMVGGQVIMRHRVVSGVDLVELFDRVHVLVEKVRRSLADG